MSRYIQSVYLGARHYPRETGLAARRKAASGSTLTLNMREQLGYDLPGSLDLRRGAVLEPCQVAPGIVSRAAALLGRQLHGIDQIVIDIGEFACLGLPLGCGKLLLVGPFALGLRQPFVLGEIGHPLAYLGPESLDQIVPIGG